MKLGTTCKGAAICTRNDCFAYNFGRCGILIDDGRDFVSDCKFYKTQEQYDIDAARAAQKAEVYKARKKMTQ